MWSIIALFVALVCVVSLVCVMVSGVWSRGSAPARPAYFTFGNHGAQLAAIVAPSARETQNIPAVTVINAVEDCEGLATFTGTPPVIIRPNQLQKEWSMPSVAVWQDPGVWLD